MVGSGDGEGGSEVSFQIEVGAVEGRETWNAVLIGGVGVSSCGLAGIYSFSLFIFGPFVLPPKKTIRHGSV